MTTNKTLNDEQIDAIVRRLRDVLSEFGIDAEQHEAAGVRGLSALASRANGAEIRVVLSISTDAATEATEATGVARQRIRRDDGVTFPTLGTAPAAGQRFASGMPAGAAGERAPEPPTAV